MESTLFYKRIYTIFQSTYLVCGLNGKKKTASREYKRGKEMVYYVQQEAGVFLVCIGKARIIDHQK